MSTYLNKVKEDCSKYIEKAQDYEIEQKWKMAIKYYERCVECGYEGSVPYDRLVELYNMIGDANNASRIEGLKP